MIELLAGISIALMVSALWLLICNERTYRDICRIVESGDVDLGVFKEVSYESHLWMRLTFRDPMRLYRK